MNNEVRVRISGDASGVKKATREASQSLSGLADDAKSLLAPLSAVFAGVSVGAFAGKLVQVQREFDVLNASLVTATGSSAAASRAFDQLQAFAATTPFGLQEVTQAFVKLQNMGLDPSQAALNSYGNTAVAMGKSLDQMIEAVADAATGEFERLKEFGIKAKSEGDRVSLTFRGVTTNIGKNAAEIEQYLRRIGDVDFAGASTERAKTLDGALSNLGDAWTNLFRTINQAGVGSVIYEAVVLADGALKGLTANLNAVGAGAVALAGILSGRLIASTVAATQAKVADTLAAVRNQQATVAAAVSAEAFAAAKLAEARAVVAATTGMQRLAAVQTTLIPAQNALTAATAATAAAQSSALSAATLARGAMGALGGPIGLVTTALSLGASAWLLWGNRADAATQQAENVMIGRIERVTTKLNELNSRIGDTTAGALRAAVAEAETELRNIRSQTSALANDLDSMDARGERWGEDGKRKQAELDQLLRRQMAAEAALAQARANSGQVGVNAVQAFVDANVTGTAKVARERAKLQAEFDRLMTDAGGYNAANPDHVRALDTLKAKMAELEKTSKGAAGGTKSLADAGADLALSLQAASVGLTAEFYAKWEKLGAAYQVGAITLDQLTAAQATLLAQQPAIREATEEAARLHEAYAANVSAAIGPLEERARALEDELETYGLTEAQIQQTIIARIEEARAIAAGNGASEEHLRYLDREIEARKRIATAAQGVDVRRANDKAAREAEEAWKRTANAIEDALIDALMEGGKSGKEYIEGLFRSMVLRPVVQAIVQPIAGGITTALGFGAPGQAGAAGGAGGGLSFNPMSLLGGNSIGMGFSNAAIGLAQSNLLAGTGVGNYLTGFAGNAAGMSNLALGGAGLLGGVGAGLLFGNQGYASAGGSLSSTVGMIAGGPVGAVIGGLLGGAVGSLFGGGKPSDKSAWATVNPTTGAVSGIGSMTGKKDPGQEARDATAQLAQLVGSFAGLAGISSGVTVMTGGRDGLRLKINRSGGTQGFRTPGAGIANGGNALNYGYGDAAIRAMLNDLVDEGTLPQETIDGWRSLRGDVDGGWRSATEMVSVLQLLINGEKVGAIGRADLIQQEGEALEAAFARMRSIEQALQGTVLPGQALADAAGAMVRQFNALGYAVPPSAEALGQMIGALDMTVKANWDAYRSLMGLAGSYLELQAAQQSLYEQLLSDEERAALRTEELRDAFAQLGTTMPTTNAELRAMIDAQDQTTESGARMRAQMLALVPAFTQATKAAESARKAAEVWAKQQVAGSTPGRQALVAAQSVYLADLNSARSGDATALSRLPTSTSAYLDVVREQSSSAAAFQLEQMRTKENVQRAIDGKPAINVFGFAKGGTFTNSLVTEPTLFRHAGGLGEMGEAGPEAIMPLRKAAGGLGIIAQTEAGETVLPLTRTAGGVLAADMSQIGRYARGDVFGDDDAGSITLPPSEGYRGTMADADAPRATARPGRDMDGMVDELRRLHAEVRELNAEVRLLRRDNNGANAELVTQAKRQTRIALKWDTIGMPATAAPAEG